jgi:hypothetical protein
MAAHAEIADFGSNPIAVNHDGIDGTLNKAVKFEKRK